MTELFTRKEAAAKLRISVQTLDHHVAVGDLRYIQIGRGGKWNKRLFTQTDLDDFISHQTRERTPHQSPPLSKRRTTSKLAVIDFDEVRRKKPSAKPKP